MLKHSIRQIFFNLKAALIILAIGITVLSIQLINITQYSDRLSALKNQHLLIQKIVATNTNDLSMASITLNGDTASLALFAKLSSRPAILDFFMASKEEQFSLNQTLQGTSKAFQDAALMWLEALSVSKQSQYDRMISARNIYLVEIDQAIDYQIRIINDSIVIAQYTVLILLLDICLMVLWYQRRLTQIYADIKNICAVDIDGGLDSIHTEEADFIGKRLARKTTAQLSPNLLHPLSGIANEGGITATFNARRGSTHKSSLYLALFSVDNLAELSKKLSQGDMATIYKKLAEMLGLYEQPLDILGQLKDGTFFFLMARNSKDAALLESEKIVESTKESLFVTGDTTHRLTLSASLMLKIPSKTIEESIEDGTKILAKAKEQGGNRVAQLRERPDSFR